VTLLVAAVVGFAGVAIGAFGAHALSLEGYHRAVFETGARYHLIHALALLVVGVLAQRRPARSLRLAAWAFGVGVLVFSGTLYLLAALDLRWLGAITPLGGVSLLVGWGALAAYGWRQRR